MSQSERKLAAIMFTDMVGYTALGQRNESLSLALLEEQRRVVRPVLSKHYGREVKTIGDAFLVVFPNAVDAVRCAYDIQRAVRESNLSLAQEKRIHLRIGVHVGEVVELGGDVSGDAVNVASRIEHLSEDGGVSVTRQTYDQVKNKVDLRFLNIGFQNLKNVIEPVEVFRMVLPWADEMGESSVALDSRRVAVLPFANMSPDPQDEFFADGLTEELIDRLSRASELQVIARTSVMSYKKKDKKAAEIGRELKTGSLVEGSVRRAGNKVRVTAQLINASNEAHLWSSSYDRELQDIFAVQSDIAERVAEALAVRLLPNERRAIEKKPTSSADAHMLYLKGRYLWNERTPRSAKASVEYFERATRADPSFALAYVGLADAYVVIGDQGVMNSREAGQMTRDFAEKALALDPTLAEAHATLGVVLSYVFWEWSRSEMEFKKSIELNPAYPTARQWYGKHLSVVGKYDEAVEQHRKALQLDPFSLIININYAEGLVAAGRYAEGIQQATKTVALDPNFAIGHFEFGMFYVGGKEFDKAEEEFKRVLEIVPDFHAALSLLSYSYSLSGRRGDAEKVLSQLRERASVGYVDPSDIGLAEFGLGMEDEAFGHFEVAMRDRSPWAMYYKVFPAFDSLRKHPRFVQILARMGLA